MGYGAGNTIWYYYTSDNLASNVIGTVNATYFKVAYTTHVINGKTGDLIHFANSASPVLSGTFVVSDDWDSNGASVIRISGPNSTY
jgi:hypothetical protein